nr:HNH endonuclease signature motif containing protein [uncultured Sediminibacterium sp.]
MTETVNRLWILKSKGEESSFGGNSGYPDDPVAEYVYDTNVKNYNKLKQGDQIIIADKNFIKGYATITSVKTKENVPKIRYKCPECKTHEFGERKTMSPRYKCRNKHEFDEREEEQIVVKEFTAYYGSTFVPAAPATSVKILEPYYLNRNRYYSIQAADPAFFVKEGLSMPVLAAEKNEKASYTFAPADEVPSYSPDSDDLRARKTKDVVVRKGQQKFKEMLIRYYGHWCMITGCEITEAIQASHIFPYRGEKDNNPRNGLLLRIDLHVLFDANLLGIDPDTLTVALHPRLSCSSYGKWEGHKLAFRRYDFIPSAEALRYRWNSFCSDVKKVI